jgi:translation elongation factor P/translation initiation factor 5A
MIAASQLREGMALRIDKQIYKVLEAEAKASGRLWEPHFRPDERLEQLELERRGMEFLYRDAG